MEQNSPRVDDSPINIFSLPPYPNSEPEVRVSERSKSGATLLFSGIFMGLVGITFTIMGWVRYDDGFEWTKLIGPIMLSVSVTFVLISVCRFKMIFGRLCKRHNDTVAEPEQPTTGQSFVFTGINQPISFHGATVLQYIPPPYTPYDAIARNPSASSPVSSNSTGILNGIDLPISPPQYYSVFPLENPAFVEDDDSSQSPVNESSPVSSQHHEHIPVVESHSGPPPLYEDLYPELK
ncbi:transmembrane protein 174-like isoform X2 [Leptodactylus fuscus]|uniref:transmembrane protein 174-like isoform X2 n=1 Tax=Leptodactylus fuscus TaxID=238119 RepID=UPI003F4E5A8C